MFADLPFELKAAIEPLARGRSRSEIARRAALISEKYRAGGGSGSIAGVDDALAYVFTRMPATYAAITAVLAAIADVRPNFSPTTLIDVGSGPGTAALAAARRWPDLDRVRLIDRNPHLREIALALLQSHPAPGLHTATYDHGDGAQLIEGSARADLVIASYFVGEIEPERLPRMVAALWSTTADTLVVIEPGTPAGFSRVASVRAHLIAQGARVLCPCPHDNRCPIVAPDWCHFAQRFSRSRDHRVVKGTALSFEDEKYSYVVLARAKPERAIDARVLAPPHISKAGVTSKLCTSGGIVIDTAARRERDRYRRRKGWRWGDAVTPNDPGAAIGEIG